MISPVNSQEKAEQVCTEFNDNLLAYPDAIQYVNNRGLTLEQIREMKIGYCPPYSNYRFFLLKGRIIVPIRDVHGSIVAFAGRIFEPMQNVTEQVYIDMFPKKPEKAQSIIDAWERAKWINEIYAKNRHLFNLCYAKEYIREEGYAIIVEGYLDALVLYANGIKNVVALCGTTLSEKHISLLARYCRKVILFLDSDEAGKKSVSKIVPELKDFNMYHHVVSPTSGEDPDELVIRKGGDKLKYVFDVVVKENKANVNLR